MDAGTRSSRPSGAEPEDLMRELLSELAASAPDLDTSLSGRVRRAVRRRRRRRAGMLTAAAAVVAVVAVAPAQLARRPGVETHDVAGPVWAPTPGVLDEHCANYAALTNRRRERLPDDVTVTGALWCDVAVDISPSDQRTARVTQRWADRGLEPLVRALRVPDETGPTPTNFACAAVGYTAVRLWLRSSRGEWIAVRWPEGVCGGPLGRPLQVVRSVPFVTTATALVPIPDQPAAEPSGTPG